MLKGEMLQKQLLISLWRKVANFKSFNKYLQFIKHIRLRLLLSYIRDDIRINSPSANLQIYQVPTRVTTYDYLADFSEL